MTKKYQNAEWLQDRINEGLTIRQIAERANASMGIVHLYLHKFDIKPNNPSTHLRFVPRSTSPLHEDNQSNERPAIARVATN